ncbi:MAG: hypothetical protein EAZ97_14950 [Bacteroidetes bacterium]|nr:MAG: hypothetical protein EAZ97_14950 [Bacteroidota bacterium]
MFAKIVLTIVFLAFFSESFGQKYLMLDHYSTKRIRIYVGDQMYFKLQNDPTLYNDFLVALGDSTIFVSQVKEPISLSQISAIYFPLKLRKVAPMFTNLGILALISAAVGTQMKEKFFDPKDNAITGLALIGTAQILKLFKWKKFFIVQGKSRIRVMDMNFSPLPNSVSSPEKQ